MGDSFLFLLDVEARFRLAHDRQQWIIQRRTGSPRPGKGSAMRDTGWTGISFIGSDQRVLRRCIREAGVILTATAEAQLDQLPDQFLEFIADSDSCRVRIAA